MMTLPKFENPNITTKQLLAEQKRLHAQAGKMLATTKLSDTFARYGKISTNGSYDYGLMVYPDLDMGVAAPNVSRQDFARLVGDLAGSPFVRKIGTADTVNFPPVHADRPKGYWLGLEIPFEDDRWGVDIWLQTPEWATADNGDRYKERLAQLDERQIAAVLAIKYHLIRKGLYDAARFRSVHVYDAVLNHGVLSFDDFVGLHPVDG